MLSPLWGQGFLKAGAVSMPKMKSNRSAMKRFRLTANGKVRRNHAFVRHLLTHKVRERKRRLRHATLASSTDVKRIKRMLLA